MVGGGGGGLFGSESTAPAGRSSLRALQCWRSRASREGWGTDAPCASPAPACACRSLHRLAKPPGRPHLPPTSKPSRPMPELLGRLQSALAERYRLSREIGAGGMATVYLAEEAKHGRQVAIKVLRPELAATLGAERFLREIGIAARLSHPHLVPLIDSGDAGGLLYYVSSYMPGGSLRERLQREGKLSVRDALRIAEEVSTALDYAHRAGFVHRDVKPENILFADGHALLADFGVARVCHGEGDDRVTAAGIAVGTPEYMSPEQASGDCDIDGRSDIYALACVMYEMLTGAPPFQADSHRALMARHVLDTPPRVRALHPEIPSSIDDAISLAMAKDPAMRFGSSCDFVSAMRIEAATSPYFRS